MTGPTFVKWSDAAPCSQCGRPTYYTAEGIRVHRGCHEPPVASYRIAALEAVAVAAQALLDAKRQFEDTRKKRPLNPPMVMAAVDAESVAIDALRASLDLLEGGEK